MFFVLLLLSASSNAKKQQRKGNNMLGKKRQIQYFFTAKQAWRRNGGLTLFFLSSPVPFPELAKLRSYHFFVTHFRLAECWRKKERAMRWVWVRLSVDSKIRTFFLCRRQVPYGLGGIGRRRTNYFWRKPGRFRRLTRSCTGNLAWHLSWGRLRAEWKYFFATSLT